MTINLETNINLKTSLLPSDEVPTLKHFYGSGITIPRFERKIHLETSLFTWEESFFYLTALK